LEDVGDLDGLIAVGHWIVGEELGFVVELGEFLGEVVGVVLEEVDEHVVVLDAGDVVKGLEFEGVVFLLSEERDLALHELDLLFEAFLASYLSLARL